MKTRVIHKGLLIVAVPVVVELLVIALLSYLLVLIDLEHKLEYDRRNLSIYGARLTFGNSHAGLCLMNAWRQKNPDLLQRYEIEFKRLEKLCAEMKELPPDSDLRTQKFHLKCVENQDEVLKYLRQMSAVTQEGFSLEGFRKVQNIQRKLYRLLDNTFAEISKLVSSAERTLQAGQEKLRNLERMEILVIFLGFIAAIMSAFGLLIYFRRNFSRRIASISENVEKIARREDPESAIEGSDEIAELDQAFHQMWQQLAQASEREKALFRNSSDIICVLDEQLRFVQVSDASVRLWAYEPELLSGKKLRNYLVSEEPLRGLHDLARSDGFASFELSFKKSNGDLTENLWTLSWSAAQQQWYGVVHDIAELKQAEAQRRHYLEQIAEDFQSPILRISEHIDKLLSGECGQLPAKANTKFNDGKRSLSRMLQLIDELQQVEDLNPSEIKLEKRNCSIKSVLQEALADVEILAHARRIKIETNIDDGQWQIDSAKMVRVIVNLLSNAIKFSPDDSCIRVEALIGAEMVTVLVQDSGRGISESALRDLFEPFTQAQAADGARGKGTGLGLFICQKIARAHGGEIVVESEENKGSTFRIQIPKESGRIVSGSAVVMEPGFASAAPVSGIETSLLRATASPAITDLELGKASFWGQRNLSEKAAILIGAPAVVATIFVIVMMLALFQSREALVSQMQRRELGASALSMNSALFDFSGKVRHAASERELKRLASILNDLPEKISQFRKAASYNVVSAGILAAINQEVDAMQKDLHVVKSTMVDKRAQLDDEERRLLSLQLFAASDNVSRQVERLLNECESKEVDPALSQPASRTNQALILDGALLLNLWLAFALAAFFSNDIAKRLKQMADNSVRFTRGDSLLPLVPGRDEIAELDKAFHDTAGALKSAREKESAFLTNSESIICALNRQAQIVTLNPATCRLLDRGAGEILNRRLIDLLSEEKQADVQRMLDLSRQSVEPLQFETEISGRTLRWSVIWSAAEENYFCTARDISAQKELEELKKRFIAILTHDLRTPLAGLLGFTGLAQEGVYGPVPDTATQTLTEICQEIDRILELVNDLLDLEKLQAGHMQLNDEVHALNDLILEAIKQLDKRLTAELESTVPDRLNVTADKNRFGQVIASLILEAQSLNPTRIDFAADTNDKVSTVTLSAMGVSSANPEAEQLVRRLNGLSEGKSKTGSRLRVPLLLRILSEESGQLRAYFDGDKLVLEINLKRIG